MNFSALKNVDMKQLQGLASNMDMGAITSGLSGLSLPGASVAKDGIKPSENALPVNNGKLNLTAYSQDLVDLLHKKIEDSTDTIKNEMIAVIGTHLNNSKKEIIDSIVIPTQTIAKLLAQQLDGTKSFQIFIYALLKDNFKLFEEAIKKTFKPQGSSSEELIYNEKNINNTDIINKIIDKLKNELHGALQSSNKKKGDWFSGGKLNRNCKMCSSRRRSKEMTKKRKLLRIPSTTSEFTRKTSIRFASSPFSSKSRKLLRSLRLRRRS